jgi:hypothetical protein
MVVPPLVPDQVLCGYLADAGHSLPQAQHRSLIVTSHICLPASINPQASESSVPRCQPPPNFAAVIFPFYTSSCGRGGEPARVLQICWHIFHTRSCYSRRTALASDKSAFDTPAYNTKSVYLCDHGTIIVIHRHYYCVDCCGFRRCFPVPSARRHGGWPWAWAAALSQRCYSSQRGWCDVPQQAGAKDRERPAAQALLHQECCQELSWQSRERHQD